MRCQLAQTSLPLIGIILSVCLMTAGIVSADPPADSTCHSACVNRAWFLTPSGGCYQLDKRDCEYCKSPGLCLADASSTEPCWDLYEINDIYVHAGVSCNTLCNYSSRLGYTEALFNVLPGTLFLGKIWHQCPE